MSTWVVRRGALADVPALSRITVDSWRATYRGMVPDALLDGLHSDGQRERWVTWLARPAPSSLLVSVDDTDTPVAYCAVCPVRADSDALAGRATGELLALYADPAVVGRGAGRAAHDAGVAALVGAGYEHATLWVLSDNTAAQSFYRARGWTPDGVDGGFEAFGQRVPEQRWSRSLTG